MKKLILIPALILIFAACNKEEKKMEKVGKVKTAAPALSVTSNITVLKNDNNSNAVFFISDIADDDTINITFQEPS